MFNKNLLILILFLLKLVISIKNNDHYRLVPDYNDIYYYKNINIKIEESLSISNCTVGGDNFNIKSKINADLFIKILTPSSLITNIWGVENNEIWRQPKVYIRTSNDLCTHKSFLELKKGFYKRAKGCAPENKSKKNVKNIFINDKYVNDYAATFHPSAFRCDNKRSVQACTSSSNHPDEIPYSERTLNRYPFIIEASKLIVSRSGMIALPCGPFGLFTSCESVKWGVPIADSMVQYVNICRNSENKNNDCPFPKYDKVFVMTQYDDTQIGQFILEALPKLVYHLDYLLANPSIKIHYGFTKQPILPPNVIPHTFFDWLGLRDRLINGTIYARDAMIPREGGCQDAAYNAWEVINMRDTLLRKSGIFDDKIDNIVNFNTNTSNYNKRSIVIVRRGSSPFTQNQADYKRRRWPQQVFDDLINELNQQFVNHRIEIYSDLNHTLMRNPNEGIKMFNDADIVIGMHGAGLTNTLYMKPGAIVCEVLPYFDSRHAPIIGIFPRLSAIIGLHHLTYNAATKQVVPVHLVQFIREFIDNIQLRN